MKQPFGREPLVSVVLAARNERDTIARCLAALSNQTYGNYEIIVADDRSTDGTAAIVREEFPNVTLVRVESLPEGFAGKSHAISTAVARARGQWLLFTDADTEHSRDSIRVPLNYSLKHGVEMLSLLPQPLCIGFWEKVIQPLMSILLFMLFPLERVNRRKSRTAVACGQYTLMDRRAYERMGGHAAVRAFPLEDIEMARRAKRGG